MLNLKKHCTLLQIVVTPGTGVLKPKSYIEKVPLIISNLKFNQLVAKRRKLIGELGEDTMNL